MYKIDFFIKGYKTLPVLSEGEINLLLEKINDGDFKARDKMIECNISLVFYEVMGRFKEVEWDKSDLISSGLIGLIKAVDTFDINKNFKFSTYAVRCIDNEILLYMRKLNKDKRFVFETFETPISCNSNDDELKLGDVIKNDIDIVNDYEDKFIFKYVKQIVESLPEFDREIIKLYFGFNNNDRLTQNEIAKKYSISQAKVCRIIARNLKMIGSMLQDANLIELRDKKDKQKSLNFE